MNPGFVLTCLTRNLMAPFRWPGRLYEGGTLSPHSQQQRGDGHLFWAVWVLGQPQALRGGGSALYLCLGLSLSKKPETCQTCLIPPRSSPEYPNQGSSLLGSPDPLSLQK